MVYEIIVSHCAFRERNKTETRSFFKAEKNTLVYLVHEFDSKENFCFLSNWLK
jgi:hypothetical protein